MKSLHLCRIDGVFAVEADIACGVAPPLEARHGAVLRPKIESKEHTFWLVLRPPLACGVGLRSCDCGHVLQPRRKDDEITRPWLVSKVRAERGLRAAWIAESDFARAITDLRV